VKELERLLDGRHDELGLAMLRAASDEAPSEESFKAAAAALGLSGAAVSMSLGATATSSGAVASLGVPQKVGALALKAGSLTGGVIAKHVLIGMLGGAVAMGGVSYAADQWASPGVRASAPLPAKVSDAPRTPPRARPSAARPEAAVVAQGDSASPALSAAGNARRPLSAASSMPQRAEALLVAPTVPARPSSTTALPLNAGSAAFSAEPEPVAATPSANAMSAANKSLAIEVALLDRARAALLRSNPNEAMRALEQYRHQRQSTILEPEATVLQIRAFDQLGQRATASRLARSFIQSHPQSRHVEALRALAADGEADFRPAK
jgi:hypothetical protein